MFQLYVLSLFFLMKISAVSNFIESKYKSPFNIENKEGYIIRFLALNKLSFFLK